MHFWAKLLKKWQNLPIFLHLVNFRNGRFWEILAIWVLPDVDFTQKLLLTCDFGIFQQFLVIFCKNNLVTCQFVTISKTRPLMSASMAKIIIFWTFKKLMFLVFETNRTITVVPKFFWKSFFPRFIAHCDLEGNWC